MKKKNKKISACSFRYKLTELELDRMAFRGVISFEDRDLLIKTSRLREPGYYASRRYQMAMNGRGTIMLNSVNFNGGETFGEPHHFLAELTHTTTPGVFNRFIHANNIPVHPFKE